MKNTLISILTLFLCTFSSGAIERKDSVEFFFPQSVSHLDTSFKSNGKGLDKIREILSDSSSSFVAVKSLLITGAASPEGSIDFNRKLSDKRAQEIREYLINHNIVTPLDITTEFVGRDWKTLSEYTGADSRVPHKEEVMNLLTAILHNDSILGFESKEAKNLERLKALDQGNTYSYLYNNIFPLLRRSKVILDYYILPVADTALDSPDVTTQIEGIPEFLYPEVNNANTESAKNYYMDLKTNLLYDAAALPTLGIEFYLGKNFSIGANWTYGWWDRNSSHRYWRAYGGDVSVRWWFGSQAQNHPLSGHHIGIFGGITTFDFEFGGEGRMGGLPGRTLWDRCMRFAGVEYGYSLPVARRFNIDFSLGIGYLGGKYIKYVPKGNGYLWQSTNKLTWIGPVKAEISLVWLIGKGNVNKK